MNAGITGESPHIDDGHPDDLVVGPAKTRSLTRGLDRVAALAGGAASLLPLAALAAASAQGTTD